MSRLHRDQSRPAPPQSKEDVSRHRKRSVRRVESTRERVEGDVDPETGVQSEQDRELPTITRGECADVREPERQTRRGKVLRQQKKEVLLHPLRAPVDLVDGRDLVGAFEKDGVARASLLDVAPPD